MKKTIVVAVITSVITAGLMAVTFAVAATPKRHAPATAAAVSTAVQGARPVTDQRMRSVLGRLSRLGSGVRRSPASTGSSRGSRGSSTAWTSKTSRGMAMSTDHSGTGQQRWRVV